MKVGVHVQYNTHDCTFLQKSNSNNCSTTVKIIIITCTCTCTVCTLIHACSFITPFVVRYVDPFHCPYSIVPFRMLQMKLHHVHV